jgi:hypothetical protein
MSFRASVPPIGSCAIRSHPEALRRSRVVLVPLTNANDVLLITWANYAGEVCLSTTPQKRCGRFVSLLPFLSAGSPARPQQTKKMKYFLTRWQPRNPLDRIGNGGELMMAVDLVRLCVGVPGELLSDVGGYAGIGERAREGVTERVKT